jgi:hypothetical protein
LASFRQRLAVRVELEPLGLEEAADYVLHQLRASGGRPDAILANEAVEIVARGTGGLPRLLNQAAHQALMLTYEAGAQIVDAEAVLEAFAVLGLGTEAESSVLSEPVAEADDDTDFIVNQNLDQVGTERILWAEDNDADRSSADDGLEHADTSTRFITLPKRPA